VWQLSLAKMLTFFWKLQTNNNFFCCVTSKKCLQLFFRKKVDNKIRRNSTVSLIHDTMRTKVSKHLCQNFPGFFRIFGNQNFLGLASHLLHHWVPMLANTEFYYLTIEPIPILLIFLTAIS